LRIGGDLLHSKGYKITIKGLNPTYLAKSIYEVQIAFTFFARIQTKNSRKHCNLGILQCKIYNEPKEHQKDSQTYLQNFPPKQKHHNLKKLEKWTLKHSFLSMRKMSTLPWFMLEGFQEFLKLLIPSEERLKAIVDLTPM
jgi:hypothetical protein